SKDDKLRLRMQAEYFRQSGKTLDVVLLQEVWTDEYVTLLKDAAAEAGLVHATTFDGGVLGAGLLLLSRFTFTDVAFRPYSVRGEAGALQGEAMAGKGIGYARVQLPYGGRCTALHIFNTHTHANWVHSVTPDAQLPDVKVPTDTFAPYRTANILDAVAFVKPILVAAQAAGDLVLAGGDWNVPVDNLEAALLLELLPGLRDAWQLAGHSALDSKGNTCGDPGNVYTGSIIGGYVPERIDFLWTNSSRVLECETVLKIMPGTSLNYSDHFGVYGIISCEVDNNEPCAVALVRPMAFPEQRSGNTDAAAIGCWGPTGGDINLRDRQASAAATLPRSASSGGPFRVAPGPIAESKVAADPTSDDSGGTTRHKLSRRVRLLQLAREQLRAGIDATTAGQKRLLRRTVLFAAVTLVAIAVQLYGIIAETDHWAKRLAAAVAVAVAPAALGLCLSQVVWMSMGTAGRRGFGQLLRMVEVWETVARAEVDG
ncbi:hypothetical protein VaNZ11_001490, partial [Volvox africanus]